MCMSLVGNPYCVIFDMSLHCVIFLMSYLQTAGDRPGGVRKWDGCKVLENFLEKHVDCLVETCYLMRAVFFGPCPVGSRVEVLVR